MEESVFYNLSQDETLGGDSPSIHKIPSQAALKAYIDSKGGGGGDDWTPKWFYVEDASGAANTLTIKKSNNSLADKVFEWSLDKQNWTEITITDTTGVSLAVPANGRVYLRGDNGALAASAGLYTKINCSAVFNVGGDITTLIAKSGNQQYILSYCFRGLFDSSRVKDASLLQLTPKTLNSYCYQSLFSWCSSLTAAPELPATTLEQSCYQQMFLGCSSLTTTPNIPDVIMASNSMAQMFTNCSSLVKVVVSISAWNSGNATQWLNGVAATGDFYNLGGATIPTGTNGIPSGWTEHTALP